MGFLNGFAGALLAILLTPLLQHYFWSFQRLSELRFNATNEVNKLMAGYLTNCISESMKRHAYDPDKEFYQSLMVVEAQIQTLFSAKAYTAFKELEKMIGSHSTEAGFPQFGPSKMTVDDCVRAKEIMLRALYKEVFSVRWNVFKSLLP